MQLIDWYAARCNRFQSSNYRDYDGHGTHCGGTAIGLNFGWASTPECSAHVSGPEGSGDSGGISISNCFDVTKVGTQIWIPKTGYKRPNCKC